jgi:hypothetical protein
MHDVRLVEYGSAKCVLPQFQSFGLQALSMFRQKLHGRYETEEVVSMDLEGLMNINLI